MVAAEIDILGIARGTVTAPAGCGKTHLIIRALMAYKGTKPILVLTHTNAGVAALRGRLEMAGVPTNAYRLCTIDGWAIRLISTFPARSAHDPTILKLQAPARNYPAIREAAWKLLEAGHVNDVVLATYAQLIVDEYQDCSVPQHAIVYYLSFILPTCVLGDPMQAIFGFQGNALADWDQHVCAHFPIVGELRTPWRWRNAGAEELGQWLLESRRQLTAGGAVDLRSAPRHVTWVQMDGANDHQRRLAAARTVPPRADGRVLIIGDSTNPESQRTFASQTPGAVTVEAVDLRDLVNFGRDLNLASPAALDQLLAFAQSVMTNVGASEITRRMVVLSRGTARNPPTDLESAALAFSQAPSHSAAADLLMSLRDQTDVRVHRPAILHSAVKALRLTSSGGGTFEESAIRVREENRLLGRPLPRRAVGSTLLLKGLEAEVAVILNADGLNAQNLYVAMTRGSMALVVCSSTPVFNAR